MTSEQIVDTHPPAGDKLAIQLECRLCDASRTYVLDATIRKILAGDWQAVRIVAVCHCGYVESVSVGWHHDAPGYTSHRIKVNRVGPFPTVVDDAGICPGCERVA